MKTLTRIKAKELASLNFQNIEVFEVTEASSDDLTQVGIRDKVTGEEVHFKMRGYGSDFSAFIVKPKEYVDKFALSATLDKIPVNAVFDTEQEAKDFAEKKELINVVIKPTKVEKE